MVTRTELTRRVEALEQKVLVQTHLTDRVTALELVVEENKQYLQNLATTASLLSKSVVDLQTELVSLKIPQKVEKEKSKRTKK